MSLQIKEYYAGKNVMLSGCTGFLGKVVLEKLFRSCPLVNKIYVMVRPKRNVPIMERVKKEILSAYCFSIISKQHPNFMEWAQSKIVPIAGDLVMDKLGLSDSDRAMVTSDIHVLINCAASVNFDDPLQDALRINYFGCMRMLELAHECKQLQVFTHVSTCYVNCNRPGGLIEEQLYDVDMDVDETVRRLMAMNPQEVEQQEKKLIGDFPNTYTFTKNLAEKSLFKKKGNLQCVLFRPSIIASSAREPFPGWTDSLSAAGGLTLMCSLGLINFMQVKKGGPNRFDMIPVDIVTNGIIISTAHAGSKQGNELDIYNCGTSDQNPISVCGYKDEIQKTAKFFSFNKKVFNMHTQMIDSETEFKLKKKLFNELPLKALEVASKIPKIGTPQMQAQVQMLKQVYKKTDDTLGIFDFFVNGDWHFQNKRIYQVLNRMSPEERQEFDCDCRNFEWETYVKNYIKGISIWALKENQIEPSHGLEQIVIKNKFHFDDMKLSLHGNTELKNKSSQSYEPNILNETRFQDFFRQSDNLKKAHFYDKNQIQEELKRLRCSIQKASTKATFYILSKMIRQQVEGMHVDTKSISKIKEMVNADRKVRIVYMPIYKSYQDPLVMHYINYFTDQELGFTFGHYEDSPKIAFVDTLMKQNGSLLIRRNPKNSLSNNTIKNALDQDVTDYINQALFQEVLENNSITTIYQNDSRIRSGKIHPPQNSDQSVKMLIKSFFNLQKLKFNVKIVPVCINYDRIFDSHYLANEMISGRFRHLNMPELLVRIYNKRQGKLGKIFVKYADPIDLNSYIDKYQHDKSQSLSLRLTKELYQIQQREQPITMNSLISTSILFNPLEEADFLSIRVTTKKMYDYIRLKNCKTYISSSPSNYDIQETVLNLGFTVKGKPLDKKLGDKAIVNIEERNSLLQSLAMSYYANQLAVNFSVESIIAHSFNYLSKVSGGPITVNQVFETSQVVSEIFKDEFLPQEKELDKETVMEFIKMFEKEQMFKLEGDFVSLHETKRGKLNFLICLLQAIVDSYVIVAATIYELQTQQIVLEQSKLVNELHICIQEIFRRGGIKFMSSCLFEVLNRAFARFSLMGVCNAQSYDSQSQIGGGKTIYISCPIQKKETVVQYLNILTKMSSSDQKGNLIIEKQVSRAVFKAQGPMARI